MCLPVEAEIGPASRVDGHTKATIWPPVSGSYRFDAIALLTLAGCFAPPSAHSKVALQHAPAAPKLWFVLHGPQLDAETASRVVCRAHLCRRTPQKLTGSEGSTTHQADTSCKLSNKCQRQNTPCMRLGCLKGGVNAWATGPTNLPMLRIDRADE